MTMSVNDANSGFFGCSETNKQTRNTCEVSERPLLVNTCSVVWMVFRSKFCHDFSMNDLMMRAFPFRKLTVIFFVFNVFFTVYLFFNIQYFCGNNQIKQELNVWSGVESSNHALSSLLTIGIVDFESSADHPHIHDLEGTISHLCHVFPGVRIVVFTDSTIYPPLNKSRIQCLSRVRFRVSFSSAFSSSYYDNRVESYVTTESVLFIPDFARFPSSIASKIEPSLTYLKEKDIKVLPTMKPTKCIHLDVEAKYWTLRMSNEGGLCDYVLDTNALLIKTKSWLDLKHPLLRPLHDSLFIQRKIKGGYKIWIDYDLKFSLYRSLREEPTSQNVNSKRVLEIKREQRLKEMYPFLGFKRVFREDGVIEWYGCKKTTERCFSSIVNDMPDYLYEGKWTPPCCLHHLRETAVHVLTILEKYEIRHWLEGGSLLGAVRSGDIIPWDSDVDIGVYEEDIAKLPIFETCSKHGPVKDERDFVWEKALEGNFYRVHFSATNRIHVDIFPFYSVNGTMTKDFWFPSHPQDRPFPESFLIPLKKMHFIGIPAFVPNNAREFLEYKFGSGVVENPRLPDQAAP